MTDQIMSDGLEHRESSDDRSPLRALLDDPIRRAEANPLPARIRPFLERQIPASLGISHAGLSSPHAR
jgi:hypothetical protein